MSGPCVPALVYGLALLAVAVLVVLTAAVDVSVDLGLVLPLVLVALGALLVAGAVVTGLRRRR